MFLVSDFQRLMRPEAEEEPQFTFRGGLTPEGGSAIATLVEASHAVLKQELIARIHAQPPEMFERLVIDVLLAMGYGGSRDNMARCLGRSGDGGIDGIITLDELGFDSICIQAKRLKPGVAVPIADVRDFAGSLEAHHALKGVLFATTHFSTGAEAFCAKLSRKVVLVDGDRLAELMIRYNIGVTVQHCFVLKHLEKSYFAGLPGGPA